MGGAALAQLAAAFADDGAVMADALAARRRPIRVLGVDAPRAHLAAWGFQPVRMAPPPMAHTPRADAIMGEAAMGQRGRRLIEALTNPDWFDVPVLMTQADATQPQIFAALRELARLGQPGPRHVHFYDHMAQPRAASAKYNAHRLAQLDVWLAQMGGVAPDDAARARAHGDAAAQAGLIDQLNQLRARRCLSGADALVAMGGAARLPLDMGNAALAQLAQHVAAGAGADAGADSGAGALAGRPIILCGSAHDSDHIYRQIESAGALIMADVMDGGGDAMPMPARMCPPDAVGRHVAERARALGVGHVLHLSIDGDEAAPWDVAALHQWAGPSITVVAWRCTAQGGDALAERLAALFDSPAAPPAAAPAT
ncbi:MAG: hypothetical protein ACKOUM_09425, partial [Sphingopyxis sp.]